MIGSHLNMFSLENIFAIPNRMSDQDPYFVQKVITWMPFKRLRKKYQAQIIISSPLGL